MTRQLQAVPSKAIIAVLVIALIGFADAAYLSVEHYKNVIPPCSIGACEKVLTSAFSTLAGVPVSLLGAVFYLVIACGLFAFLESRNHEVLRLTLLFTVLGFLASLWFVFLQVFILHSYCLYCMGSATTSTLLFVCAIVLFEKYEKTLVAGSGMKGEE